MQKSGFWVLLMLAIGLSGCHDDVVESKCNPKEIMCTGGVSYVCTEDVKSHSYWKPEYVCASKSCENEYECEKKDGCTNGHNDDGSCKHEGCIAGYHDNGSCVCPESCANGCKPDGSCINKESCVNGLTSSGDCACPESCKNGCMPDGSCSCSDACVNGCENDGSCKPREDCANGVASDGGCVCPETCKNGCDLDGSCICSSLCVFGCGLSGECVTDPKSCVNGYEDNGTCACPNDCVMGGCESNGACIHNPDCINGWKSDGSCACPQYNADAVDGDKGCKHGCNENGSCKVKENVICPNGYTPEGDCYCSETCMNGCDENGACLCPETCRADGDGKPMCDATGATCCPDNCEFGCDTNGVCLCSDMCPTGCNANGACCTEVCENGCGLEQKCTCPAYCEYTDADGKKCEENGRCKMDPACKNGHNLDGSCVCNTLVCRDGCYPDGSCINISQGACIADEHCKEVSGCEGNRCYCHKLDDNNAICKRMDVNSNHMLDLYDLDEEKAKACKKKTDCTEEGTFCDSNIGYVCAQDCNRVVPQDGRPVCLPGTVCRADGRCAPEAFVTLWSIPSDRILEIPFYKLKNDNQGNVVIDENYDYATGAFKCDLKVEVCDAENDDICSAKTAFTCNDKSLKVSVPERIKKNVRLSISGDFKEFAFSMKNATSEMRGLLEQVLSFGPVQMTERAFGDCKNLTAISHTDIPDSTRLVTMKEMFTSCNSFNDAIGHWDVSNVKSMYNTFAYAKAFNQFIGRWDVSSVTTMYGMFNYGEVFNQNIGDWDVSKVTSMDAMFYVQKKFNQDISRWDVSNVKTMSNMFCGASAFDQDLSKWDVSNVITMYRMFDGAVSFKGRGLQEWKDKIKNVINMGMMFRLTYIESDITKWNVSGVSNMESMFQYSRKFEQDLSEWKISKSAKVDKIFDETGLIMNSSHVTKTKICKICKAWCGIIQNDSACSYCDNNISSINNKCDYKKP